MEPADSESFVSPRFNPALPFLVPSPSVPPPSVVYWSQNPHWRPLAPIPYYLSSPSLAQNNYNSSLFNHPLNRSASQLNPLRNSPDLTYDQITPKSNRIYQNHSPSTPTANNNNTNIPHSPKSAQHTPTNSSLNPRTRHKKSIGDGIPRTNSSSTSTRNVQFQLRTSVSNSQTISHSVREGQSPSSSLAEYPTSTTPGIQQLQVASEVVATAASVSSADNDENRSLADSLTDSVGTTAGESVITLNSFADSFLTQSSRGSSMVPPAEERRLEQRQKQIDYGKNTVGYDRYRRLVPRSARQKGDPQTPDKHMKCSKRCWDGLIRSWRRKLHQFDPADSEEWICCADLWKREDENGEWNLPPPAITPEIKRSPFRTSPVNQLSRTNSSVKFSITNSNPGSIPAQSPPEMKVYSPTSPPDDEYFSKVTSPSPQPSHEYNANMRSGGYGQREYHSNSATTSPPPISYQNLVMAGTTGSETKFWNNNEQQSVVGRDDEGLAVFASDEELTESREEFLNTEETEDNEDDDEDIEVIIYQGKSNDDERLDGDGCEKKSGGFVANLSTSTPADLSFSKIGDVAVMSGSAPAYVECFDV
ncbi:hypothetical protein HK098_005274 [Nowakowskiella sp. JEL0407]|nr:hypothetical protein HK098_005274 [Nowakowskiella sp. JEL0407]